MANATESAAEKAHVGDHVKLIGSHRFAGFTGTYITDRVFYNGGGPIPVVKLSHCGTKVETLVHDPKNQMRKL
jgi:hypothetical protein